MIVDGINLKKIDDKLVRASAKKFGVKVAPGSTVAALARALKDKLGESDGELDSCTVCGAPWPAELSSCPFCGETDDDREEKGERAGESSGAGSSVMGGTASEEPPDSPAAMVHVERAPLAALGGGHARVAEPQVEGDLDAAVAWINVGKAQAAKGMGQVIFTLKRIIDTNLWKLRTDDKGGVLYRSWTEFANKELEMSRAYAERLLKVEKEFGRQLIEELGVNKLVVVVQAPPEKRSELLEKARAGVSRAKLQAATKELNITAGKNPGKGKAASEKAAAPPAKKPARELPAPKVDPEAVTILTTLGKKHSVKLFRPKKEKGAWVPAKKLEDGAYGWLDFSNGQRLILQLGKLPTGQLVLAVVAKREA
jgi:hypothetical protein